MPRKSVEAEPLPHRFKLTGKVKDGKTWGTTSVETACQDCGLSYWVGEQGLPAEDCPVRIKLKEQENK